jgi:hypothetical protein
MKEEELRNQAAAAKQQALLKLLAAVDPLVTGNPTTTKSQYPDPAELEYPLMRLNALLDNIASKLDK